MAVHRAARIGATGHGGQILVSQATQTLVEDEEEDLHIHLEDLGEQRVKDLDRPVRLYQANSDGLPAEFAPLRPALALPGRSGGVGRLWRIGAGCGRHRPRGRRRGVPEGWSRGRCPLRRTHWR